MPGKEVTVTIFVAAAVPHTSVTVYEIVVVPPDIPVTTPVVGFTLPAAVFVLLHTPPLMPLIVSVVVALWHRLSDPLIVPLTADGSVIVNV